ncbi:uncharacterized protein MYCGRDRAFT_97678 [Zymoseptoria tritici IPO323]|uniref:Uncharacterized protein n=1 Tax=Zymoseptoria tritici (strain CBS 115943 / IPO323) TaxID=336722 RepID=F9XQZ2_ZYMTI|nr:uncharacterized protein MYCGRDRAFT_97678 [Zymoseptoria tritici IPO323]EGP82335.1 hypothetical protein MYCGRDRAFT_97678 [Zymoseptoria tritici IPO323]
MPSPTGRGPVARPSYPTAGPSGTAYHPHASPAIVESADPFGTAYHPHASPAIVESAGPSGTAYHPHASPAIVESADPSGTAYHPHASPAIIESPRPAAKKRRTERYNQRYNTVDASDMEQEQDAPARSRPSPEVESIDFAPLRSATSTAADTVHAHDHQQNAAQIEPQRVTHGITFVPEDNPEDEIICVPRGLSPRAEHFHRADTSEPIGTARVIQLRRVVRLNGQITSSGGAMPSKQVDKEADMLYIAMDSSSLSKDNDAAASGPSGYGKAGHEMENNKENEGPDEVEEKKACGGSDAAGNPGQVAEVIGEV